MTTSDHDPTTRSPLQQPHRIVSETRCFSAITELFVDGKSDDHRIYVRRQQEIAITALLNYAALMWNNPAFLKMEGMPCHASGFAKRNVKR